MDNNWIINNLKLSFSIWNDKMIEIWMLVSTTPEDFKGGSIWNVVVNINGTLQAVGYGLLVVFFAMSIFKSASNFRDFKRPEQGLAFLIRFVATKTAITYGMDIMTAIFKICGGIVASIAASLGGMASAVALPSEIETAINDLGFLASIPLWLVTLLGCLFITVMSFLMILTVYGRFFKLYMYTALAPIPLSCFAGNVTAQMGKAFIKSYIGVCLEGAIIVLACILYSAFLSGGIMGLGNGATDTVSMVWAYLTEVIFSMLILVGLVKGADRIVKEMLAL